MWTFEGLKEAYAPSDPDAKKEHVERVEKLAKMAKALGYKDEDIADFDAPSSVILTFKDGICISIDDMNDYV